MSDSQFSRTVLEINLEVLATNIRAYQEAVSPAEFMAVVKANGYGTFNLTPYEPVVQTCLEQGVRRFAVSCAREGQELRKIIPGECQILLLGNFFFQEAEDLVRNRITLSLSEPLQLLQLKEIASRFRTPVEAQIVVDTGMGRLGIPYKDKDKDKDGDEDGDSLKKTIAEIITISGNSEWVKLTGLYSHLSNAHIVEDTHTLEQIRKFTEIKDWVKVHFSEVAEGPGKWEFHLANSWGAGNYQASHQDLVRVGIGLYGVEPQPMQAVKVKSAVTLKSRLLAKRYLSAGHCISYDCCYRLPSATWVGTVAAGYADGIPLALSSPVNHGNGKIESLSQFPGYVLIRGKKAPILGKVTMDYTMVDLSDIDAKTDDEVIFFGRNQDEEISVKDFADSKKTHGYEVLCSIPSPRVPRVYIRNRNG